MKKIKSALSALMAAVFLCVSVFYSLKTVDVYAADIEPDVVAPAVILMEANSGQIIYEKNADEVLHPASITKIMTLLLIFEALEEGTITLDENITVSEYAAGMGGSQVFLEAGEIQSVQTMIKCISVASANDASVAMAERICGSEAAFVEKMNEKAKELGMTNTHFVNCCGLDDDAHLTTARDVALMSRELITKYPQVHDYSTIWMDTITHVTRRGEKEFQLANTNKLIRQYEWATGLKTGSTSKAKCCLSATAKKNNIELIAVVMAAPNSKIRFSDAIKLLNYGYSVCSVYTDKEMPKPENINVRCGKQSDVGLLCEQDFTYMFLNQYDAKDITREVVLDKEIEAPFEKGTKAGEIIYYYKGNEIGRVNVVTEQAVEKESLGDSFKKIFGNWLL